MKAYSKLLLLTHPTQAGDEYCNAWRSHTHKIPGAPDLVGGAGYNFRQSSHQMFKDAKEKEKN